MQMGEAFAQYALSSEKLYRDIVTDNVDDYRFAQWRRLSRWWWY